MVLQIAPDRGAISDDRNAKVPQELFRTDTREHQDLRRVDGATAQDDFRARLGTERFAPPAVFNTRRPRALKVDALDERIGFDAQVGARTGWVEIGAGGAPAPAVRDRHLVGAESLLL